MFHTRYNEQKLPRQGIDDRFAALVIHHLEPSLLKCLYIQGERIAALAHHRLKICPEPGVVKDIAILSPSAARLVPPAKSVNLPKHYEVFQRRLCYFWRINAASIYVSFTHDGFSLLSFLLVTLGSSRFLLRPLASSWFLLLPLPFHAAPMKRIMPAT